MQFALNDKFRKDCRIIVDLSVFPVKSGDENRILGMTEDQLILARTPTIPDLYADSRTYMFYRFGCFIIDRRIPRNVGSMLSSGASYKSVDSSVEDQILPPHIHNVDVKSFLSVQPRGLVTALDVSDKCIENISLRRSHTPLKDKRLLVYSFIENNGWAMMRRVELLLQCSDKFLITNMPMREQFDISRT